MVANISLALSIANLTVWSWYWCDPFGCSFHLYVMYAVLWLWPKEGGHSTPLASVILKSMSHGNGQNLLERNTRGNLKCLSDYLQGSVQETGGVACWMFEQAEYMRWIAFWAYLDSFWCQVPISENLSATEAAMLYPLCKQDFLNSMGLWSQHTALCKDSPCRVKTTGEQMQISSREKNRQWAQCSHCIKIFHAGKTGMCLAANPVQ